ncbi:unnamed protein product [Protopolystoma xenopodis]|uniref:Uncharacterized protein n=1 Tax=Protopolystoma xenopodis TaxID=117903 RepID=A0A3S5CKS1_9PLAT|nr:unnamed protein product [Protopolystoma xenopodis]
MYHQLSYLVAPFTCSPRSTSGPKSSPAWPASSSGQLATCQLGDLATVYSVNLDARMGREHLGELVSRCGWPRLALVVPEEAADGADGLRLPIHSASNGASAALFSAYSLSAGQKFSLGLPGRRLHPVNVSPLLASCLAPVRIITGLENGDKVCRWLASCLANKSLGILIGINEDQIFYEVSYCYFTLWLTRKYGLPIGIFYRH